MSRPTVIIADDNARVLAQLVGLLKDQFDVVAAVGDGQQLVDAASRLHPEVAITDLSMPKMDGFQALKRLKADSPEIHIIVLSMHAEAELAAEALRSGASAYVLKLLAADELIPAIQEVLAGRVFLTAALRNHQIE